MFHHEEEENFLFVNISFIVFWTKIAHVNIDKTLDGLPCIGGLSSHVTV